MNKEFIPYEQAIELKELGFDEECFDKYDPRFEKLSSDMETWTNEQYPETLMIPAPLYQQAFRWFREKCNLPSNLELFHTGWDYVIIARDFEEITDFGCGPYETYEEAELACLNKLIEIVKNK